jgi:hypothetical protein
MFLKTTLDHERQKTRQQSKSKQEEKLHRFNQEVCSAVQVLERSVAATVNSENLNTYSSQTSKESNMQYIL